MSTVKSLDWLIVGATVAYIAGSFRSETVTEATVTRVGKRDVLVDVNGRVEKFNINCMTSGGNSTWLHRNSGSAWNRGMDLAPLNDPVVAKIQARERRDNARCNVRWRADEFQKAPDVPTARRLRDAVDLFLLHEPGVTDTHP